MFIGLSVLVLVTCAYGICYSPALSRLRRLWSRCFRWENSRSLSDSGTGSAKKGVNGVGDGKKTGGSNGRKIDVGSEKGLNALSNRNDEKQTTVDVNRNGTTTMQVPTFMISATESDHPETTPKAKPALVNDTIPTLSLNNEHTLPNSQPSAPAINIVEEDDDDYVPSFPAINSAQRASGPSRAPPTLAPRPAGSMPPPPIPNRTAGPNSRRPIAGSSYTANPQTAAGYAASQRNPRSSNSLQTPPTITQKPKKPRKKIILEPGHSPLDWAKLQRSGIDLRVRTSI